MSTGWMMQQGTACGLSCNSLAAMNSLDLDQSNQQLSLPVQQYEHVVVEPRGHRTVLRFPWLAGGSLAFPGRYATTLQRTGQQASTAHRHQQWHSLEREMVARASSAVTVWQVGNRLLPNPPFQTTHRTLRAPNVMPSFQATCTNFRNRWPLPQSPWGSKQILKKVVNTGCIALGCAGTQQGGVWLPCKAMAKLHGVCSCQMMAGRALFL
jgi:hypothetical protein